MLLIAKMKKLFLLLSMVVISATTMAQTKLTGIVYDETKLPMIGASVVIKGTTNGTVTNSDGNFTISTERSEGVLTISFMGYETVEKEFSRDENFKIYLNLSTTNLEDIVIVGYGNQKKSDLTGAIENVRLDGATERPVNSVQNALQGNISGVTVINQGGDPTESPMVRVRGIGTLSNEAPLYVVDGMPGAPVPNVEDIKTMTVLKDASSAAIYGIRAAAGVILIETKGGKGSTSGIGFNCYWGVNLVNNKLTPLNAQEFTDVMNTAFDNAGYAADFSGRDYLDPNKNPYGAVTRTNWVDEIFQKGFVQNYNVTANGSSDKVDYYTSARYRKNEGILLNTYHEVFNFRINSNFRLNEKLTISENIAYEFSNGNYGVNTSSGYTGTLLTAIYYPSSATIWEDKEARLYGGVAPRGSEYIGSYGDVINPVAYLHRLNNKKPTHKINGNVKIKYDILSNLSYQLNIGGNISLENEKNFTSKITEPGKVFNYNKLYQSNNRSFEWLIENTLNYSLSFNKNKLDVLVGYTMQSYEREWWSMNAEGFASEAKKHQYFANASGPFGKPGGGKTGNKLLSYLGRVNYNHADKYLLTVIARRDGSTKLSKENRWEVFPSVSGAWRVKQEDFMQAVDFISDLKFRAGWGKIGNLGSLSDFPASVPLGRTKSLLGETANYDNYLGFAETALSNRDIKWETTTQTNYGIDFSLFERRLSGSVDYYTKDTEDMLLRAQVNALAGVNQGAWENMGSIKNKGFEFSLTYKKYEGDFRYSIGINASKVKNEVKALSDQYDNIQHDNTVRGIHRPLRSEVGQPIYSFYVYENDGLFQNDAEVNAHKNSSGELLQPYAKPGDLRFVDRNKDGSINEDDKYFAGSGFPKLSFGINGSFEYKNFDLSYLIQGASDYKVFNGVKFTTLRPIQGYNMLNDVLDAWSETNTGSDIPKISLSDENNNFGTTSDWYLEDASYIRLKNVTLGYNLPEDLVSKLHLSSARIYLSADNLLTITDYSGFDPEVISDQGIDMGKYPLPKTFIVGLSVKF